jgi:hypothetical protein
VQSLVININFTHFGLDSFPQFLLQSFGSVMSLSFISELRNTGFFDKGRQPKWNFVDASFILKVAPFLSPVPWDWH